MANVALGLSNQAKLNICSVTGGSQASSSLAVSNVTDRQLQKVWRSASDPSAKPLTSWNTARYLQAAWTSAGSYSFSADCIALLNDNYTPPGATDSVYAYTYRVRALLVNVLSANYTLAQAVHVPPSTIKTRTNLSGAISTVQDSPWTPDTNWMTATSHTTNTELRCDFLPAPVSNGLTLKTGVGVQKFAILVRRSGSGGTDPTCTVELYENGSLKASLSSGTAITSTTGQVITASWNASSLTSTSTTQTEVRITGTAGTTRTVEIGAIEWQADSDGYLYDSGAISITGGELASGRSNLIHYPSSPPSMVAASTTVAYLLVDFDATTGWSSTYNEVGYLFVGPLWRPATNIEFDYKLGWEDVSRFNMSSGGQEWANVKPRRRVLEMDFQNLTESEAYAYLFDFDRDNGVSGELLVAVDTGNSGRAGDWTFLARQASLDPIGNKWLSVYQKGLTLREQT